jgi:hypothetical protein
MKIVRAVSLFCIVCLAGGVLAGIPGARADDCDVVPGAAVAQARLPHAVTHVTNAPGKPPSRVEMIFVNDKAYTQLDGAWHSMAYSAQEQINTITAANKRMDQTPHTCQKLASPPINGEAVSLFVVRSDVSGNASEARFWISDKTGLPMKSEIHLKSGSIVTDDFHYGDIKPPPGVN